MPIVATPQKHDRRLGGGEEPRFRKANVAVAPHIGDRRVHQREWLLLAMLPVTKSLDGALLARVDHQMKSAQTFDGHNQTAAKRIDCGAQGLVALGEHGSAVIPPGQLRAADRTRVGLGVEPAIGRIVVLLLRTPDTS